MSTVLAKPASTVARRSCAAPPDDAAAPKPAHQGAITVADQAVVSLVSFVGSVIVGYLGKESLGLYTLGMSTMWMLVGIPNALVWVPYTSRAARMTNSQRERYAASCSRMVIAIAAGLSALSLLGGLAAWGVPEARWIAVLLLTMSPMLFTMILREHVRRMLCAEFRAQRMLLLDLPVCVLQLGAMIALYRAGSLTAERAMLLIAGAAALGVPWTILWARQTNVPVARFWRETVSNWQFGRWMLLVAVAWLLSEGALRWMLTGIHGAEALGQFGAVLAIVMLINPLMLAITSFSRSWAARVYDEGGLDLLMRHTQKLSLVGALFVCLALAFLYLFGDLFVTTIFGQEYSDPFLLMLVATGVCLQAAAIPVEAAQTALEQGRGMSLVAVGRLVTTLACGVPLVWLLGPDGVGWTMVLRSVVALVMAWLVLQLESPQHLSASAVNPASFQ